MRPRSGSLFLFLLFFTLAAWPQEGDLRPSNTLAVKILVTGTVPLPEPVRLELLHHGAVLGTALIDGSGQHTFTGLQTGQYTLIARLYGLEVARQTVILLGNESFQEVMHITFPDRSRSDDGPPPGAPHTVSARVLALPAKARQEFDRAYQRFLKSDWDGAIEHQRKGLALDPTFAPAHLQLGRYYRSQGEIEKATDAFRKAAQLEPDSLDARLALAEVLEEQEQYQAAGEVLQEAHLLHPERAEPFYLAARVYYRRDLLEEAEASCQLALEREHRRLPEAHLLMVNIHRRRGSVDGVVEHLEAYLEEAPQGAHAEKVGAALVRMRQLQAEPIGRD